MKQKEISFSQSELNFSLFTIIIVNFVQDLLFLIVQQESEGVGNGKEQLFGI
ncbi:unnamed protein product [Paramecium octaurelia]|uniref:Uncharacterized protein n=1 Tax=Paramecium octaurelia TaxID=43137 RepID=A0A8S1UM58_PAROT|nr:unnamed protein product [Paramecium octaurelia]